MSKSNNRPTARNSEDKNVQRKERPAQYENDPLLALIGTGKHLWADEHADDYVRRLREDWDTTEPNPQQPELRKKRKASARQNIRRGRSGRGGR